ncbi:MAG: hypothetical protein HQL32_18310, partial [Planctomycetes bacterium]|nr:hypothetical protein [Planctomycetota bacterium]
SQFGDFLFHFLEKNPAMKLLGLTATPFRLGHGYIFCPQCKNPYANWFQKIHYRIGIEKLQSDGYLCPYQYLVADGDIKEDLESVPLNSFGDYQIDALEETVIKEEHLMSAVKTLQSQALDRKSIVIFCVSISHSNRLRDLFLEHHIESAAIHSQMSIEERDDILNQFNEGGIRILTNVNVLTEGWDSPRADAVILCRPTFSPALYVQMVGRGLRLHQDKKDCLVLDLVGCFEKHGSIKTPIVKNYRDFEEKEVKERCLDKECPECENIISLQSLTCPYCLKELKPCVVYKDAEQRMIKIDDDPTDYIVCEECQIPHAYKTLEAEFMSDDPFADIMGVLYCAEGHVVKAMEESQEVKAAGSYELINLRSKLSQDEQGDFSLIIAFLFTDEHKNPFTLKQTYTNSTEDLTRLRSLAQKYSDVQGEFEDTLGMPARINRGNWQLAKNMEVIEEDGAFYILGA